jgi:tetratricopeptide (TPR) repeat protein
MLADLDARAPPPEVHVDNRRGGLKFRLVRGDGSAQSQRKTMLLGLLLLVILIAGGLYFPESWREQMRAAAPDSNSEQPQEPVSEPESDSSHPPDGPVEAGASEFDSREAEYDTLLDEEKARVLFLAQEAISDTRKDQVAESKPVLRRAADESQSVNIKPKSRSVSPPPASDVVDVPVIQQNTVPKMAALAEATVSEQGSAWDGQYNEALALLDAGRVSEGEQALRQILLKRPDYLEARVALARVLVSHNRSFEAQLLLEQVREALSVSAKLLLARLYLAQNEAQKAVTLLEATDGGGSGEYYAAQGNAYQKLGQFDRAAQIYQRAVLAEPNEGRWWLGLAIAFESVGNASGAGQAYQRAAQSANLPVALTKYAEQRWRAIQQRRE